MTRREDIIKLLSPLLAIYPNSKVDGRGLVLYASALQTLSLEEIEAALARCLRTCKFFPTPAEIFDNVEKVVDYVTDKQTKTAAEAYDEVLKQAKRYPQDRWTFTSEEIEQAINQFGRSEFLMIEEDAVEVARAHFKSIYEGILQKKRERRINQQAVATLPKQHVDALKQAKIKALMEGCINSGW